MKIDKRCPETGEWTGGSSFRLFTKDGSPGWRYQKARPCDEVSVDQFVEKCGLETKDFMQYDEAKKVYQFSTFCLEEFDMNTDGTHYWVTSLLWIPAYELSIPFEGGRGTRKSIAMKRFFNSFNELYEGVLIEDEDDDLPQAD